MNISTQPGGTPRCGSGALRGIVFSTLLLASTQLLAEEMVLFRNRPAQVNDRVTQSIQCDLDAEQAIRQHNQIVDKSKQTLHRDQVRMVTVLEVDDGSAAKARIDYAKSTTKVTAGNGQVAVAKHPIEGKAYLVTRNQGKLLIASASGGPISAEEEQILRIQLQTFGLPNPLAGFLDGKRLRVGESIDVPDEVARELLGLTGNQGKTDKLALRLTTMRAHDGVNCAVFETLLRSHSDEASVSLLMKGELLIDPMTCQTHSIQLNGPVAISQRRGPPEGRFIVSTNGTLRVAVKTARLSMRTANANSNQRQ